MAHRIELSNSSRAGCTDAGCKKDGIKIIKGELRFGSWVQLPGSEKGSWKWRHWGCVSGAQIKNMRDKSSMGGDDYRFDAIDGYDELDDHPEVQEKIRRVIRQGHIDPEDFKGDPDYNVLGRTGIRGRARKPKETDDDGEEYVEHDGSKTATPAKKTPAKRGRKKAAAGDDEEEADEEPPKKKARGPVKTAKTPKKETDVEDEPPVKAKGKKATVAKVKPPPVEDEDDGKPEPPKKKGRAAAAKTASKAPVKKGPEPQSEATPESEPDSELEDLDDADFAQEMTPKEEDEDEVPESEPEEYAPAKRSRKGKAASKKAAPAKGSRQSTRNKR